MNVRIVKCRLQYIYEWGEEPEKVAKLNEKLDERERILRNLGIPIPSWSGEHAERDRKAWLAHPELILPEDKVITLLIAKQEPKDIDCVMELGGQDAIERAMAKFEKIAANPTDHGDEFINSRTESPMSNSLLHSFNQVALIEDACSDHLQNVLNEGWRLIAVCPQPQRRPDYVLGRFNPDFMAVRHDGSESPLPSNAVRP